MPYKHLLLSIGLTFGFIFSAPLLAQDTPPGNTSLYFDGSSRLVSTPLPGIAIDNITLEAWVKIPPDFAGGGVVQVGVSGGYAIYIDGSSRFGIHLPGVLPDEFVMTDYFLTPNRWTHLAIVRNGGTWNCFADAVVAPIVIGSPTATPNTPSGNLFVGFSFAYFEGQIDEVRSFDIPRSQANIATDRTTDTDNGARGFWRFEAGTGQAVLNSGVGGGLDGFLGSSVAVEGEDPTWAFRVTNVNDAGLGTLRWAIYKSNVDAIENYIDFSIQQTDPNATGVRTISLADSIMATTPVYIDGYSAFGSLPNSADFLSINNAVIRIEIDASGIGAPLPGKGALTINDANDCLITGLAMFGMPTNSGSQEAIRIQGNSSFNAIEGNYIGLRANGTAGPTNMNGVAIVGTGTSNVVGYDVSIDQAAFNVISNNNFIGLVVSAPSSIVRGNYIGTDITGNTASPNNQRGIVLTGSNNSTIANNLISGNQNNSFPNPQHGVITLQSNSNDNTISDNIIGLGADNAILGNQMPYGISILTGSSNNLVGVGNTIIGTLGGGILIDGATTLGNRITTNAIYLNGSFPITLSNGGNGNFQAPVISTVTTNTIAGTCLSCSDGDVIEVFFGGTSVEAGANYFGSAMVNSGNWSINGTLPVNYFATATATQLVTSNTSGYSTPTSMSIPTAAILNLSNIATVLANGSAFPFNNCRANLQETITIRNTGTALLSIATLAATGDFSIVSSPTPPFDVPSGGSAAVTLQMAVSPAGTKSGTFSITSNAVNAGFFSVNLSGNTSLPAAPTNLSAALPPDSVGRISLAWFDNDNQECSFELQRAMGNSLAASFQTFSTLPANSTKAIVEAEPNITYFYRIRSVNQAGASAWSNISGAVSAVPFSTITATADAIQADWQVFPNPTSDGWVRVKKSNLALQTIRWQLFNTQGGLVLAEDNQALDEQGLMTLNLNNLPVGMYVLHLRAGAEQEVRLLMVEK